MEDVYLYGAGGHAKVIIDILKSRNTLVKAVYDDNPDVTTCMDIPVVNGNVLSPLIISIGNNGIRKKIAQKLANINVFYAQAIDKSAIVSESVIIEQGTVVMQGAIIQSSTEIGKHTIINTGATIDHDCLIGDYVHIAPGCNLCGNVKVGEGTFIGAGTVVIPGVTIGKWAVVGAGSIVRKDIADHVMVVGNPCKIYKNSNNEP